MEELTLKDKDGEERLWVKKEAVVVVVVSPVCG